MYAVVADEGDLPGGNRKAHLGPTMRRLRKREKDEAEVPFTGKEQLALSLYRQAVGNGNLFCDGRITWFPFTMHAKRPFLSASSCENLADAITYPICEMNSLFLKNFNFLRCF